MGALEIFNDKRVYYKVRWVIISVLNYALQSITITATAYINEPPSGWSWKSKTFEDEKLSRISDMTTFTNDGSHLKE